MKVFEVYCSSKRGIKILAMINILLCMHPYEVSLHYILGAIINIAQLDISF